MRAKRIEMAMQIPEVLQDYSLAIIVRKGCPYYGHPYCLIFGREEESRKLQERGVREYTYYGKDGFIIEGRLDVVLHELKKIFKEEIQFIS